MSAYVCSGKHFATIAKYAIAKRIWLEGIDEPASAEHFGLVYRLLARANVDSVCQKYGDKLTNYTEVLQPQGGLEECPNDPLDILSLCDGYEYQCDEWHEWEKSLASKILDRVRRSAIRDLPGYADSPWSV